MLTSQTFKNGSFILWHFNWNSPVAKLYPLLGNMSLNNCKSSAVGSPNLVAHNKIKKKDVKVLIEGCLYL